MISVEDYGKSVAQRQDMYGALHLAKYYKEKYQEEKATYWTDQSRRYFAMVGVQEQVDAFIESFFKVGASALFYPLNERIARVVAKCSTTRMLSLESTDYDSSTVKRIARFITVNRYVQYFTLTSDLSCDIQKTKLSNKSVKIIANALEVNKTIEDLQIIGHPIEDEGALHVIRAIDANPKSAIRSLGLDYCHLSMVSVNRLRILAMHKPQILICSVAGNNLPPAVIGQVAQGKIKDVIFSKL